MNLKEGDLLPDLILLTFNIHNNLNVILIGKIELSLSKAIAKEVYYGTYSTSYKLIILY